MIWYRRTWFNVFMLFVIALLCLGIQSTLWFQITGGAPSPQLWLNIVLFVILFRRPRKAFFIAYGLGWLASSFSSAPLSLMLPALCLTVGIGIFLKSRFFWTNTRYFILASFATNLIFQFSTSLISYLFGKSMIPLFSFDRVIELILTPLFAAPIYWTFVLLDRWMDQDMVAETAGAEE